MRDTEYRVVSDLMYVIPVSSKIPMKLAAMLGGRGLSIYSAALTILDHVRSLLNNNTERYKYEFVFITAKVHLYLYVLSIHAKYFYHVYVFVLSVLMM